MILKIVVSYAIVAKALVLCKVSTVIFYALVRVYRYHKDKKESCTTTKLNAIQTAGIWDCTLCGACNIVCPQNIDIKGDILQLQNLSVQNGYQNPAFSSSFESSFSFDGGFNPNGF